MLDINIKKRHILMFFAIILGLILIIPNYQKVKKILNAKELSEISGEYRCGDYVNVDFDEILYVEYEGIYGGTQKRYEVCSTLEGDVFYVNGLPEEFVLVEILNEKTRDEIVSGQKRQHKIIGIVEDCTYDINDFLKRWDSDVKLEKRVVIREVGYREDYITNILNGCFIILFCLILFQCGGGVHSIVKVSEN